jgi:formylglycine-generating enzyme required for sulfatase activity
MTLSSRVFLAHASEDKPAVRRLYQELKARGFEPWLDEEDLVGGQNWKVEIPKAIEGAGVFLACLSRHSIAKMGYVQNEFRLALNALAQRPQEQIYLIPVRLEECKVPELRNPDLGTSIGDHHWVNLFADGGLDRLARALTDGAGIAPASSAPPAAPVPLQVFRDIDAPWCPEMVVIPAGRFLMGSPPAEEGRDDDEGPQHFVTITKPFALGRYPVTFAEYDEFAATTMREPPSDDGWGRGRRPAIMVSWDDAQAYVAWLSGQTGETYRLPSEAEWEYACRAGTTTPFHVGATISTERANYNGTHMTYGSGEQGIYRGQTLPVGAFPANAFGLCDMHGTVWEWCADGWHENYVGAPADGSAWLEGGKQDKRVARGGSWFEWPGALRSADRMEGEPGGRYVDNGFRVAKTLR